MQVIFNNKTSMLIIVLILVLLLIVPSIITKVKVYGYKLLRTAYKAHVAYVTNNYQKLASHKLLIKYSDVDVESVQLVEETTQEIIKPVNQFFNFEQQETIPVIIYPSMESLNDSFGWDGDKSPMGVYWMGTIRVLAPEIWIDEEDQQSQTQIFKTMGPMAHEYTHLVVDYKTNGNYTRWFTEGIAQYIEKKLTGFTLDEPEVEAKGNLYPFDRLDSEFDAQANQELAYWQSLLAIEYLVDKYDENVINRLLDQLEQGLSLDQALQKVTGEDLIILEKGVRNYARNLAHEPTNQPTN